MSFDIFAHDQIFPLDKFISNFKSKNGGNRKLFGHKLSLVSGMGGMIGVLGVHIFALTVSRGL